MDKVNVIVITAKKSASQSHDHGQWRLDFHSVMQNNRSSGAIPLEGHSNIAHVLAGASQQDFKVGEAKLHL